MRKITSSVREFLSMFRKEGSFTQNLAITFSGNVIAQFIGLAFTPFIARIYGPEAYGVFALFIAVVNNVSPVSTLQLPSGYVAARNENEFNNLLRITLLALLFTTAIFFGIIYVFQTELIAGLRIPELKPYMYWMPVCFLLMGIDNMLLGWNIKLKEFKRGAVAKMFSTLLSRGTTVLFAILFSASATGIIIGNFLSYPFESIVKLSPGIRTGMQKLASNFEWSKLKVTAIHFKEYILYVTPGLVLINLSAQLPIYYFSLMYNQAAVVGLFALANSMINLPLMLFSNSSMVVFLQKAAETIQRSESELKDLVKKLYQKLFLLGFLPLIVLAFISPWVFRIIFGAEWEESGVFASYLCIGALFYIPYSPLSVLFRLLHREKVNFLINIIFIGIKFFGLWLGIYYNSIILSVIGYSVASLLTSWVSLVVVFRMVKLSVWILIRDAALAGILVALFIFLKS